MRDRHGRVRAYAPQDTGYPSAADTSSRTAADGASRPASQGDEAATAAAPSKTSSAASSRPITLGIDAVNVPPGVLPDALGKHGAVRVQSVSPRQLAEKAGVCRGDIFLSVDHRRVRSCEQLRDVLSLVPPQQDAVAVELYRHTAHQIITVLLRL